MKYYRKLVGENCILSPIDGSAAETVAKWSNTLDVAIRTGDISVMITCEQQKLYLESMNGDNEYGFFILSKEGELIGIIRLMRVDFINRNAVLGVFIGESTFRGKGVGREAIGLVLDYAFNVLNLRNVMLETFSFNKSAIKAFEKCGFSRIGRRRKAIIYGTKEFDKIYMDILAEEFNKSEIQKAIALIDSEC